MGVGGRKESGGGAGFARGQSLLQFPHARLQDFDPRLVREVGFLREFLQLGGQFRTHRLELFPALFSDFVGHNAGVSGRDLALPDVILHRLFHFLFGDDGRADARQEGFFDEIDHKIRHTNGGSKRRQTRKTGWTGCFTPSSCQPVPPRSIWRLSLVTRLSTAKLRLSWTPAVGALVARSSEECPVRPCRAGSPYPASLGETAGSGDPALQPTASSRLNGSRIVGGSFSCGREFRDSRAQHLKKQLGSLRLVALQMTNDHHFAGGHAAADFPVNQVLLVIWPDGDSWQYRNPRTQRHQCLDGAYLGATVTQLGDEIVIAAEPLNFR